MNLTKGAYKFKSVYLKMTSNELADQIDNFADGDVEETQENIDKFFALMYAVVGRLRHLDGNQKQKHFTSKKPFSKKARKAQEGA